MKYLLKSLSFCTLAVLGLSVFLQGVSRGQALDRFEFTRHKMGTDFRIVFYAPDSLTAHIAVDAAFDRIDRLDHVLSDYKEGSELNRVNRLSGTGRAVSVSRPLFQVLETAREISEITDGAFDMTTGPYVRLWRKTRRTGRLPAKEELKKAHRSVGYNHVKLDKENRTVQLLKKGMKLDAGGIGKGYAADEVLRILKKHRITAAMVDAGGDIVAGDVPPNKEGWNIELLLIDRHGGQTRRVITISNGAVATSGDLYQFAEIDGKRYSHIIDPETGLGLTDRSKVTVIAPDGAVADAFASAISVLGPRKGLATIQNIPGIECYFIRKNKEKYEKWESEGFMEIHSRSKNKREK